MPSTDRPEACVWIRFENDSLGGMFVCGDEDGEFARASTERAIMPYVEGLVYGPGTSREGGLRPSPTSPIEERR